MKKPAGVIGSIAKETQRRATMTATKGIYQLLFNEKPKRKKKT
jgi:hypothetical protein